MIEKWESIEGYIGLYEVSDFGKVRSLTRIVVNKKFKQQYKGRVLKPYVRKGNYKVVRLSKNNIQKTFQVHRLVALAFIPNIKDKPQVNHIDGNPSNNNLSNLEWCTGSENMKHAFRIGLQSLVGEKNTQSKLKDINIIEIRKLLKTGMYHKDIAKIYNVSRRCITDINKSKTWTHIK